jgi:hypothetical protein
VFPIGCRTRRLDASLRLKLQLGERSLTDVLGWGEGVLDVVIAEGWALLTQRPELRGAPRGRNSAYAAFTVGARGVERIGLRRNHVTLLGVRVGDEVLVAALPDHAALVLCDPDLIAALAPAHVARLLPAGAREPDAVPVAVAGCMSRTMVTHTSSVTPRDRSLLGSPVFRRAISASSGMPSQLYGDHVGHVSTSALCAVGHGEDVLARQVHLVDR